MTNPFITGLAISSRPSANPFRDDSRDATVTIDGGTMRFQAGTSMTPELSALADGPSLSRAGVGVVRYSNGHIEHDRSSSFDAFNDLIQEGGDYLRTARSPTGSPVRGREANDTDMIVVSGMEITVANARRIGLLETNEYGKLTQATTARELVKEPEPTGNVDQGHAFDSRADEQFLASVSAATNPGTQVSAINDIVSLGAVSESTVASLASEAGIEPSEVRGQLAQVQAAFTAQAQKVTQKAGVSDFDDFTRWAWQHQPNGIKEAIRHQAMYRNTDAYAGLAKEYMATLDQHDPGAILEADFGGGITVQKTADGRIFLNIPGKGQFGWRQALSLGMVKVSRR